MYKLLRALLFRLEAETSHRLTRAALRAPGAAAFLRARYSQRVPSLPVEVMGRRFANPVGLAAGLDKDAECVAALAALGFGFLELGTVTPRPQAGNPPPRLFRLTRHHALINRMGFPSAGLEVFLANLHRAGHPCPLGVNLGKNRDTPLERAADDYLEALRAVYPHADYVAVNVSSPNTPGLRALQEGDALGRLLAALKAEQTALAGRHGRYVPLALKIAPDLDDGEIEEIARLLRVHCLDAVIATNTTVARPGLQDEPLAREPGGLSGAPLKALSTAVIRKLYARLQGEVPIIGVGGIETAEDAWEKMTAGADLVQLYTGLIYEGPQIVREITTGLVQKVRASGCATLKEALAKARRAEDSPP